MSPRQGSLAKHSSLKVEICGTKVDDVINPQNYNFN